MSSPAASARWKAKNSATVAVRTGPVAIGAECEQRPQPLEPDHAVRREREQRVRVVAKPDAETGHERIELQRVAHCRPIRPEFAGLQRTGREVDQADLPEQRHRRGRDVQCRQRAERGFAARVERQACAERQEHAPEQEEPEQRVAAHRGEPRVARPAGSPAEPRRRRSRRACASRARARRRRRRPARTARRRQARSSRRARAARAQPRAARAGARSRPGTRPPRCRTR